jgi:hypothetical protein
MTTRPPTHYASDAEGNTLLHCRVCGDWGRFMDAHEVMLWIYIKVPVVDPETGEEDERTIPVRSKTLACGQCHEAYTLLLLLKGKSDPALKEGRQDVEGLRAQLEAMKSLATLRSEVARLTEKLERKRRRQQWRERR